ncbi:MAG: hemin receptor [Prevotella sp.]|nr:hemin receptor [Prevotella sp.]
MKTKYALIMSAAVLCAAPVAAQETYQDTKLIENELNGTARYVGMGGAMEALGADISTMSTNPAGIGLFRRSQVSVSGGLVAQSGEEEPASLNANKTNASFDQIGFVWSQRTGKSSFLNLGFNYHKSRNFDQILTAANSLTYKTADGTDIYSSLNKFTAMKDGWGSKGWNAIDAVYAGYTDNQGTWHDGMLFDESSNDVRYIKGQSYNFGQYQKGYIGEYDFNVSGNIHDRIYLGLTFGIHDVNYRSSKFYDEVLLGSNSTKNEEDLKIDGTGYDVKFGAIFRPFEESPFRIGLYVNTPVFYDLTLKSNFRAQLAQNPLYDNTTTKSEMPVDRYDFKVYTPWKFGVSLGHTIDEVLALGFTYEYSDYGSTDNRINDGTYYDWYGYAYDSSSSDDVMNDNTSAVLKGVHTLKFGLEYKPMPELSIRAGYNYISPQFNKNGYRDVKLASPGVYYGTSADYTNWKSTNRFTLGLGYTHQHFSIDLAYQFTQTDGDFYPFSPYYPSDEEIKKSTDNFNWVDASKVSFKRNQVLLTLGYRF